MKYKYTEKTQKTLENKFTEQVDQCRAAHANWRLVWLNKNAHGIQIQVHTEIQKFREQADQCRAAHAIWGHAWLSAPSLRTPLVHCN